MPSSPVTGLPSTPVAGIKEEKGRQKLDRSNLLSEQANSSPNNDTIDQSDTGGESNPNALELEQNDENHELLSPGVGNYAINRRRVRATMPKNEKGRGPNKLKASKEPVFVDVNEFLKPISKSQRQMSTLIGVLARDPRKLSLDCLDWRFMDQQKKDSLWEEVKGMSLDFLTSLEDGDAENANANNHEFVEDDVENANADNHEFVEDDAENANANNHGFEGDNVEGDEDGEENL